MTFYNIIGESPLKVRSHVTTDMRSHNDMVNELIERGFKCVMCDTYKKGVNIYIYKHYRLDYV